MKSGQNQFKKEYRVMRNSNLAEVQAIEDGDSEEISRSIMCLKRRRN